MSNCLTQLEKDLSSTDIGSNLKTIRESAEKILGQLRTSDLFKEYTEHDIGHSRQILKICEWLMTPDVELNPIEKYLLVISAYFHDIGMVVSEEDKDAINNPSNSNPTDPYNMQSLKEFTGIYTTNNKEATSDIVFQEYIRRYHNVRSAQYIIQNFQKIGIDARLKRIVADLCQSHGERNLTDSNFQVEYPINFEDKLYYVNIQYIAILLRLADVLDISDSRTPEILFDWINPKNEISRKEWERHRGVVGVGPRPTAPKIIDIGAEVTSPDVYFALEKYCECIQAELDYCRKLMSSYSQELSKKYGINAETTSLDKVRTVGFEPIKLEISIDKEKIVNLFMGDNLYTSRDYAAIRELLLNAVEACRLRASQENPCLYQPKIEISLDSNTNVLTIKDNGTGMNRYIISNYLLKVGRSFYDSDDYRGLKTNHKPLSRFGIGFLSSFLIASKVEVITCYYKEEENKQTCLEIRDINQYVVVKKVASPIEPGTTIRLYLKTPMKELESIVRHWIQHLEFEIILNVDGATVILSDNKYDFNLECTSYTSEIIKLKQININLAGEGFKGGAWILLDNTSIIDVDRLAHNDFVSVNKIAKLTNVDGILFSRKMPLPNYWRNSCFMHDINISRNKYELTPMINRETIVEDNGWMLLGYEIESKLLPQLSKFIEEYGFSEADKTKQFMDCFVYWQSFNNTPPTPKAIELLGYKLKWAKIRDKEWVAISDVVAGGFEFLDKVKVKSFPSIIKEKDYDDALEKCNKLRDRYGMGTVHIINFRESRAFLQYLIKPECVKINSHGYSALRFVPTDDHRPWDDMLELPFYLDGQLNSEIAVTISGPLLIYNLNHPLAALVKSITNSNNDVLKKQLKIALGYLHTNSEFYLTSRKYIDNLSKVLKDLAQNCSKNGIVIGELNFGQNSFAKHDLAEFWL